MMLTCFRMVAILVMASVAVPAAAQTGPASPPAGSPPESRAGKPDGSTYDRIWKFTEWYQNSSNRVVQRVLFSGRYQHDYAALTADQGGHHEWNVRRMRLGNRVTLFRTVTVHGEVELNPQETDPLYVRVTDLYLMWSKTGRLALTVGKHSIPFTMDGATSSKELVAVDRSNLTNNMWFPQEYMPGVSVSGRIAPWVYRLGVYSAGRANRELGEFTGGAFTLAVLGYDLARFVGVKEALVTGHYVYQSPDADNTFTRPLQHTVSLTFKLEADSWGLRTDVSAGAGYLGQSNLWGVMAMPFVNLTDKVQLVGRYTHLGSTEANGIRPGLYESRLVPGRGDQYDELYLGANYYLYGHKLKLQTGLQVADMDDRANDGGTYSGVSWTTGIRVGW